MNVNDFDRQARAAARRTIAQATGTIVAVAQEAYSELVKNAREAGPTGSPVASGRFAGSFRVGINQIDPSTEPRDPNYRYPPGTGPRPLPPRTIRNQKAALIAAVLRKFKLGDTIFISNSVPYVRRIELGRHSWQTPDGVFAPTMRAVVAKFKNIRVRVMTE